MMPDAGMPNSNHEIKVECMNLEQKFQKVANFIKRTTNNDPNATNGTMARHNSKILNHTTK